VQPYCVVYVKSDQHRIISKDGLGYPLLRWKPEFNEGCCSPLNAAFLFGGLIDRFESTSNIPRKLNTKKN
jgi:hypothetical protein